MRKFVFAIFALLVAVGLAAPQYSPSDVTEVNGPLSRTMRSLWSLFCGGSKPALPSWAQNCPIGAKKLTSYTRDSTTCPGFFACVDNLVINTSATIVPATSADACFTACANDPTCIYFSFGVSGCRTTSSNTAQTLSSIGDYMFGCLPTSARNQWDNVQK